VVVLVLELVLVVVLVLMLLVVLVFVVMLSSCLIFFCLFVVTMSMTAVTSLIDFLVRYRSLSLYLMLKLIRPCN